LVGHFGVPDLCLAAAVDQAGLAAHRLAGLGAGQEVGLPDGRSFTLECCPRCW